MKRTKSRWLTLAIGVVLLALVAYFAIGVFMADSLTRRPRATPPPQVESLSAQDAVTVTARDGLRLAGTFIPAANSPRAILMVHGLDGCRSCELYGKFPAIARQLNRTGYNVLLIDLRGHGESPASRVTFGDTERWDVLGALDWLHQRGLNRVGVLGISLGAVVTVRAGLEPDGAQGINAMVLDSCFGDFGEVLAQDFTRDTGYPYFLLPGGLLMTRLLYGVDMAHVRPIDEMPNLKSPVFMIYGNHDRYVTPAQQKAMIAAKPDAEVWVAAGPDHASIHQMYPDEYMARVMKFFARTL
jgi:pimeloyl-ACP methyl ester carboxylesterase